MEYNFLLPLKIVEYLSAISKLKHYHICKLSHYHIVLLYTNSHSHLYVARFPIIPFIYIINVC